MKKKLAFFLLYSGKKYYLFLLYSPDKIKLSHRGSSLCSSCKVLCMLARFFSACVWLNLLVILYVQMDCGTQVVVIICCCFCIATPMCSMFVKDSS